MPKVLILALSLELPTLFAKAQKKTTESLPKTTTQNNAIRSPEISKIWHSGKSTANETYCSCKGPTE